MARKRKVQRRTAPSLIARLVPKLGSRYFLVVQVIAKRTLKEFWEAHPEAEAPLATWHTIATKAIWAAPQDVKDQFGTAVDFVGDNRVIFDIGGNKFRLVAHVSYRFKRVLVKFIGTHKEYDKINPEAV